MEFESIDPDYCEPGALPINAIIQSRGRFMEAVMSDKDVNYYQKRAEQERELAAAATDPCARMAHERIATEYETRAKREGEPALRIVAG
jgi:hypothetical protein